MLRQEQGSQAGPGGSETTPQVSRAANIIVNFFEPFLSIPVLMSGRQSKKYWEFFSVYFLGMFAGPAIFGAGSISTFD